MASTPTHNILILGGSFAGLSEAHYLLRHILPSLSTQTGVAYKVTLVSQSTHFYFKIAAPRVLVNPSLIPIDQVLLPIADGFKEYEASRFEFVVGTATKLDHASKSLLITGSDGEESTLSYNSLVIATGTTSNSSIWSLAGPADVTRKALKSTQEQIVKAKSILVAGGGAAGVETAGELGADFRGKKEITILSGASRLLPRLNAKTSAEAESQLKALGATVTHDVRVVSTSPTEDGKTHVKLSNGTEVTVDVYINATGWTPNTSFLPSEWLNAKGYVKTDEPTLRLKVEGISDVYAYGSVTDFGHGGMLDVKDAVKPLGDSIRLDLLASTAATTSKSENAQHEELVGQITWWTWLMSFFSLAPIDPTKRKATFKQTTKEVQVVPIGRKGGVGVVYGWRLPSIMVYLVKGKTFFVAMGKGAVDGADYKKA